MAYLVDNIIPITLSINGILVFNSSETPDLPLDFWYNPITGLINPNVVITNFEEPIQWL